MHLVYAGPDGTGRDVSDVVTANLAACGFTPSVRRGPPEQPSLLCITGRLG